MYKHNFHYYLVDSFFNYFLKNLLGLLAKFTDTFIRYICVFYCVIVTYITVEWAYSIGAKVFFCICATKSIIYKQN